MAANPWDRQRDEQGKLEPNLWYDRFTNFRLMGPERSLLALYRRILVEKGRKLKKQPTHAPTHWYEIAERWKWRGRSEAWDAEQRRKRIAADEQARTEMLQRHIEQAKRLQRVGDKRIELFEVTPERLEINEARMCVKDGIEIERRARGLPEYLIQIAAMTDDELRDEYADLLASLEGDRAGSAEEGNRVIEAAQCGEEGA